MINKKMLFGCSIGNVFEWYDYMIYAGLTPILSTLFFPTENHLLGIVLTLAIFAAGFLMRPLGSIILGHIADKHGRKKALIISIMLIGFPSLGVVILPTYHSIGFLAPLLLLAFRLLQGFSIGGELPTFITYLAESSPANKRGYYCSLGSLVPAIGIFSATLLVTILNHNISHELMLAWGWRVPFILSLFLILVGF